MQVQRKRGVQMDNQEIIQNSLDYIEENLKAEITAKDLADLSGFSMFYYYRLFQSVVGMPVMQYISNRKLLNAIYDMSHGNNKKIEVALEYGFGSYASFYKAFYREIGYTPSEFLNNFKAEKPAKIILVKEGHTMITHKKLSAILENYNIADKSIKDVYYDNSGRRNENAFYIGKDYIIKVTRDLGRINKQIELANVMKTNSLYAVKIIPTISGKEFVKANNLYFYLTKRIQGKHVNPHAFYESKDYSLAQIVGENIAKLHLGLNTLEAVVDEVNVFENVVKWALPKAKQFIDIPEHIEKSYSDLFGAIYDSLPKQIIHRDINPGNIIVNAERIGFIDFELSERNIRIYDVCYAATAILSETVSDIKAFNKWIDIYRNIVYGYEKVLKMTEDEKQSLSYVILSNQLVCIAYFSDYSKYENILNANIKMTKMIIDNFEKLKI